MEQQQGRQTSTETHQVVQYQTSAERFRGSFNVQQKNQCS